MLDHVKKDDLQTSTFIIKIWTTKSDELFEQIQKRPNVGKLKFKLIDFSNLIAHARFA